MTLLQAVKIILKNNNNDAKNIIHIVIEEVNKWDNEWHDTTEYDKAIEKFYQSLH